MVIFGVRSWGGGAGFRWYLESLLEIIPEWSILWSSWLPARFAEVPLSVDWWVRAFFSGGQSRLPTTLHAATPTPAALCRPSWCRCCWPEWRQGSDTTSSNTRRTPSDFSTSKWDARAHTRGWSWWACQFSQLPYYSRTRDDRRESCRQSIFFIVSTIHIVISPSAKLETLDCCELINTTTIWACTRSIQHPANSCSSCESEWRRGQSVGWPVQTRPGFHPQSFVQRLQSLRRTFWGESSRRATVSLTSPAIGRSCDSFLLTLTSSPTWQETSQEAEPAEPEEPPKILDLDQ